MNFEIRYMYLYDFYLNILTASNDVARALKKVCTSNGDHWAKQSFNSIASLFIMGTSLKENNLLPEGANSFISEQFPMAWKITITISDGLPLMLLFATPWLLPYFMRVNNEG